MPGSRSVLLVVEDDRLHADQLRWALGEQYALRFAVDRDSGLAALAEAADFLLIHFNGTPLDDIPACIAALKKHGKPIVCNEDDKPSRASAEAVRASVAAGASWGLMLEEVNQQFPFSFRGAADDPLVYDTLRELTTP